MWVFISCMLQKQCQEVNKHTEEEKLEEEKLGFTAWDVSYYKSFSLIH